MKTAQEMYHEICAELREAKRFVGSSDIEGRVFNIKGETSLVGVAYRLKKLGFKAQAVASGLWFVAEGVPEEDIDYYIAKEKESIENPDNSFEE